MIIDIRWLHLYFINSGANIGTHTMFGAALGRFVFAIHCFSPNFVRLYWAIQLANAYDRFVFVQNTFVTHSGPFFLLKADTRNIGEQWTSPPSRRFTKHHVQNTFSIFFSICSFFSSSRNFDESRLFEMCWKSRKCLSKRT